MIFNCEEGSIIAYMISDHRHWENDKQVLDWNIRIKWADQSEWEFSTREEKEMAVIADKLEKVVKQPPAVGFMPRGH